MSLSHLHAILTMNLRKHSETFTVQGEQKKVPTAPHTEQTFNCASLKDGFFYGYSGA